VAGSPVLDHGGIGVMQPRVRWNCKMPKLSLVEEETSLTRYNRRLIETRSTTIQTDLSVFQLKLCIGLSIIFTYTLKHFLWWVGQMVGAWFLRLPQPLSLVAPKTKNSIQGSILSYSTPYCYTPSQHNTNYDRALALAVSFSLP
jgi:hypothetical protein